MEIITKNFFEDGHEEILKFVNGIENDLNKLNYNSVLIDVTKIKDDYIIDIQTLKIFNDEKIQMIKSKFKYSYIDEDFGKWIPKSVELLTHYETERLTISKKLLENLK